MNIAILDFDDIQNPLLSAGQAKTTFEIGKLLVERGHVVEVICSHYPGSKDRTENGIRYHHIGISSTNLKLNNALYILALPFVVKSLKVDIIIECFTAPISTLMSPLWTKIPVVGLPSSFN
ncbi:glycosyltransferase, partial [Candidatus Roizmanbacteria bacterium]|nr:glycosyltransferase [Candidatus Roizmanbacteria bacterium]